MLVVTRDAAVVGVWGATLGGGELRSQMAPTPKTAAAAAAEPTSARRRHFANDVGCMPKGLMLRACPVHPCGSNGPVSAVPAELMKAEVLSASGELLGPLKVDDRGLRVSTEWFGGESCVFEGDLVAVAELGGDDRRWDLADEVTDCAVPCASGSIPRRRSRMVTAFEDSARPARPPGNSHGLPLEFTVCRFGRFSRCNRSRRSEGFRDGCRVFAEADAQFAAGVDDIRAGQPDDRARAAGRRAAAGRRRPGRRVCPGLRRDMF